MEVNNENIVTAPVSSVGTGDAGGGSRSPVPLGAAQGRCEVEAPQKTSSASVLHAKLASSSTRVSRTQAEEQCAKAIEQTMADLGKIEEAIAGAPNTKKDIKDSARSLSISIRAMMKLLLALDKVPASARDQVKTQQEQLQKQQQLMQQQQLEIRQQHRQTQEAIKKLQEAQAETSLLLRSGVGATTVKTPSHSLPSEVRDILSDQGAKIDSLANDLKALLHEQRQSPQQQTQKKPKPQPQKKQQQRLQRSQDQPQRQNSRHQLQQQPSTTERSDEGQATTEGEGTPWTTVSRRGKPRGKMKSLDLVRSRVPKGAAVTISRPAEGVTYSDIMRKVKENVQIYDLDLKPEARVTKTGGILLKVKDDLEADRLMVALNSAIGQMASVSKPSRTTPILILDLAVWHSSQDVEEAVVAAVPDLAGMKVTIRVNPGGGRVGRLDAPLPAAVRLAEMGKLHVGWSRCRVKLLEAKEPKCYRCQKRGHFAANCSAEEVRKRCFRCNSVDHLASACTVTTRRPNKSPEREAKGPGKPEGEGSTLPAGGPQFNA